MNHFNEMIIKLVRCNMDIKFIGSGQSAKAILYYITDYVSKSQLKMHVIYNALEIAISKLQVLGPSLPEAADSPLADHARTMLRKATNAIVSMQELSAQQVTLYAIQGADNYTSHSFCRLFWKHIERYVNDLLPLEDPYPAPHSPATGPDRGIDPELDSDEALFTSDPGNSSQPLPDDHDETALIQVCPVDGLVLQSSQLVNYVYRPIELDCISLWDFVAHCEKRSLPRRQPRASHDNSDSSSDS
jgi:hypothetical protein